MAQDLQEFEAGEPIAKLRGKLNAIVRKLKQLSNIQGSGGVIVKYGPGGIQIAAPHRVLLIDDKYRLDDDLNKNTMVMRRADDKYGDIGDQFRIRAAAEGEEREKGERYTLPGYKLMWLLNPGGVHTPEGGWITDSADVGLDKQKNSPEHEIPTPIRRIGQLGDIVILTDDDLMALTADGDKHVLANIRDDAHFHRSPPKDGRIYFTDTPPGDEPDGYPIIGEMVGDEDKANFDTRLGFESVEWRPQLNIPIKGIPGEVYSPRDTTLWAFPPLIRVPSSSLMAYEFGTIGRDEGWSAHYQPMFKLDTYGLGWQVKYSAENVEVAQQNAYIDVDWKLANDGEDISTAGLNNSAFLLPVPAGSTEQDLNIAYLPMVTAAQYESKDLLICDIWGRDAGNVLDTLDERLLVVDVKLIYMIVVPPP